MRGVDRNGLPHVADRGCIVLFCNGLAQLSAQRADLCEFERPQKAGNGIIAQDGLCIWLDVCRAQLGEDLCTFGRSALSILIKAGPA